MLLTLAVLLPACGGGSSPQDAEPPPPSTEAAAEPTTSPTTTATESTPPDTFTGDDSATTVDAAPASRELVADFTNGEGYHYVIRLDVQEPVGDFVKFEYGNPGQIRFQLSSNPATLRVDNRTPHRPAGVLDTHGLYVSFYWPIPARLRNSFTAFADGVTLMRLSIEYLLPLPCPCDPIVLEPDGSVTLNDVASHQPTRGRPVREDTLSAWQAVFRGQPRYITVAGGGFQNGGEQIGVGRVSPCDGPYGDVFAIFNRYGDAMDLSGDGCPAVNAS